MEMFHTTAGGIVNSTDSNERGSDKVHQPHCKHKVSTRYKREAKYNRLERHTTGAIWGAEFIQPYNQ